MRRGDPIDLVLLLLLAFFVPYFVNLGIGYICYLLPFQSKSEHRGKRSKNNKNFKHKTKHLVYFYLCASVQLLYQKKSSTNVS